MAILLDVLHLSEATTNRTLNEIYKSVHDHDGDSIWDPMDSPFVRRLVELFTERGLTRLEAVRRDLDAWMAGARHNPSPTIPPRPEGMMLRWNKAELDLARLYLEALPPSAWTLDDYMLSVDFVFQRYLPIDFLHGEAEWLATRSVLMGKVQANMEKMTFNQADKVVAALPNTAAEAAAMFRLTPLQEHILEFARTRAAEYVVRLSDDARHRMRSLIASHVKDQFVGAGSLPSSGSLQSKLLDAFATLNRDWRRIAVTEAGECQTQGYIASLPLGTKVKRVEQYKSACGFCKRIHGVVARVVSPADPDKNPDTEIWVGKDNYGRSGSPKKRVGDQLVDRTPEEMWWLPAGLVHPHCRGRWVPVVEDRPGDDPEFGDWLRSLLAGKS